MNSKGLGQYLGKVQPTELPNTSPLSTHLAEESSVDVCVPKGVAGGNDLRRLDNEGTVVRL